MSETDPSPPEDSPPGGLGVRGDRGMSFMAGVVLGAIVGFVASILVHASTGLRLGIIAGTALACGVAAALLRERFWGKANGLLRWFK